MGNETSKLRTRRKDRRAKKLAKKQAQDQPHAADPEPNMQPVTVAEVSINLGCHCQSAPTVSSVQDTVQCPVEFSRTQDYRPTKEPPAPMERLRFRPGSPRFRRNPYTSESLSSEHGMSRQSSQTRISPEIKLFEALSSENLSCSPPADDVSQAITIPGIKMDLLQVPSSGPPPCLLPSFSLPEQHSPRSARLSSVSLSFSMDSPNIPADVQTVGSRRSSIGRPPLKRYEAVDTPDSPPSPRLSFDKGDPSDSRSGSSGNGETSATPAGRPRSKSSYDLPGRLISCHSTESAPSSSLIKRRPSPAAKREKFKDQRSQPASRSFDSSAGQMLVRHVWNRMMASKGSVTIGQDIFQRMYFTRPEVRTTLRNVCSAKKITNFGGFQKAHAKAVADILDSCIRCDLDQENILRILEKCGRAHAGQEFEEFRNDYWETFGEAILWCSLEWGNRNQRTEESRKVWMDIIHFLVDNLKLFYASERKPRLRRSISPIATTSTES